MDLQRELDGWTILHNHKYQIGEFFYLRRDARRRAWEVYGEYAKYQGIKDWRTIQKRFGIEFVKCKLVLTSE